MEKKGKKEKEKKRPRAYRQSHTQLGQGITPPFAWAQVSAIRPLAQRKFPSRRRLPRPPLLPARRQGGTGQYDLVLRGNRSQFPRDISLPWARGGGKRQGEGGEGLGNCRELVQDFRETYHSSSWGKAGRAGGGSADTRSVESPSIITGRPLPTPQGFMDELEVWYSKPD